MRITVLTGDIIDSTSLGTATLLSVQRALAATADEIRRWPDITQFGFAARGGDGWQMAFSGPPRALRAALVLTASLKRSDRAFATRIAVAEGEGTLPPGGDTNLAQGPAFTASGRLLADLPKGTTMTHAAGGAMAAAFVLADGLAQSWTEAQARALGLALDPSAGTRAEMAAALGISRQATDQALSAAGFHALRAALVYLEEPPA